MPEYYYSIPLTLYKKMTAVVGHLQNRIHRYSFAVCILLAIVRRAAVLKAWKAGEPLVTAVIYCHQLLLGILHGSNIDVMLMCGVALQANIHRKIQWKTENFEDCAGQQLC